MIFFFRSCKNLTQLFKPLTPQQLKYAPKTFEFPDEKETEEIQSKKLEFVLLENRW